MLSEVVTNKEQAKKSIYGAIIGLLIVLGAFLILNTINPQLTVLTNLDGPTSFQNLTSGDVNVTVGQIPACERDPESIECCELQGGVFSFTTGTGPVCALGESVDIGLDDSGADTPEERQLLCGREGLEYNAVTGECQQPAISVIPFPSSATTESEQKTYCSGINADFRPELGGCVMRES